MDIENLLRRVVKIRMKLTKAKKKTSETMLNTTARKVEDPVPKSLSHLLSKYSPQPSPKFNKAASKKKQVAHLGLIKIFHKKLKRYWTIWVLATQSSTRKKQKLLYSPSVPIYRQALTKYKTLPLEKNLQELPARQHLSTRKQTIKKLDSALKLSKTFKKLTTRLLIDTFQQIRLFQKAGSFSYLLLTLLKPFFLSLLLPPHPSLCISDTHHISITPFPRKSENCSMIQEYSMNLPGRKSISFQNNLSSRYLLACEEKQIFDDSGSQHFDLPNMSSLESLSCSYVENHMQDDSEYPVEPESIRNNVMASQDSSIVEFEEKFEEMPVFNSNDEFKEFFHMSDPFKSSSTSSVEIHAFNKKTWSDSKETVNMLPFCEKSESVELFVGNRGVLMRSSVKTSNLNGNAGVKGRKYGGVGKKTLAGGLGKNLTQKVKRSSIDSSVIERKEKEKKKLLVKKSAKISNDFGLLICDLEKDN